MKKLLQILLETRLEHLLASGRGSTLLTTLADLAGAIGNHPVHAALLIAAFVTVLIGIVINKEDNNRPGQSQPDRLETLESKILAKQQFFQAARRRRNQGKS